ncbi:lanthionine synthetase LanC family protein [Pseudomonas chlororaphis]|uniref:Lantibiotic modifying enzyme n=1 Tax=Pseudomonas chlororaphis TaxID=587753 RepID=A0AAX3FSY0_9PSED|nr:lanthionine synthetase LanC family protein [Pseudomonas chlororaphis]AZC39399.1 hypothetical protein C4K37_5034 [Pseudomonas chlororaphis subsp. piscium]AZC45951.1 hypothetical protein C4K36_5048 [Pseudomonas chlororaphis subsp. piscium]WDG71486.1 phosphotransferase [Pseudomonas chlororaphis]WDH30730.1 phosphotransferase [Pseudomonas chlororaphis]WDH74577.1 phosphotransferase [Pseudomonas chlororaphis]
MLEERAEGQACLNKLAQSDALPALLLEMIKDDFGLRNLTTPGTYSMAESHSGGVSFSIFQSIGAALPPQGWKIHLSATIHNASAIAATAIPYLFGGEFTFKVVSDLRSLMHLNCGLAGISQIGKFITIYTANPAEARMVCRQLHDILQAFCGPSVPSDVAFLPGSLVHYRYGAFESHWLQSSDDGLNRPALFRPDGTLALDDRKTRYIRPDWVEPLFLDVEANAIDGVAPLHDRYLIVGEMGRNHKSVVYIVFDRFERVGRVLKHAFAHSYPYSDATSAIELLHHERDILKILDGRAGAPRATAFYENVDGAYLCLELVNAVSLQDYIRMVWANSGRGPNRAQLRAIVTALWFRVRELHAAGIVFRDLKPGNVLVNPSHPGQLTLVDFETACYIGDCRRSAATRGYRRGAASGAYAASVGEDYFAIGALMVYLLTGFDFSLMPDEAVERDLFLDILGDTVPKTWRQMACAFLAVHDERGPDIPTLDALVQSATGLIAQQSTASTSYTQRRQMLKVNHLKLASTLKDTILATAEAVPTTGGVCWRSNQPYAYGLDYPYLNLGTAGVALYLALRYRHHHEDEVLMRLAGAAQHLNSVLTVRSIDQPGLMMGRHGGCLALAIASHVLGEPEFEVTAQLLDTSFHEICPEYFNGAAGLVHQALMMGRLGLTMRIDHLLEDLVHAAEQPHRTVMERLDQNLGFAHGLAGVGFALSEAARERSNGECLQAAERIGYFLLEHALPLGRGQKSLAWPAQLGVEQVISHGWCHGTTGFGAFFLSLARCSTAPVFSDAAVSAGRTVGTSFGPLDSTLCHGLAGALDFLLDLEKFLGPDRIRSRVAAVASALMLRSTVKGGHLVWVSETPEIITADLWVGMAGVGAVLERFDPHCTVPRLLSCDGVSYLCGKLAR